jgi:hypothetical protein
LNGFAAGAPPLSGVRSAVGLLLLVVAALAPPVGVTVLTIGLVLSAAVAHHVWTSRQTV